MKKTVIFDVDGTLYYQNAVRKGMLWKLLRYYLIRPHRIGELAGIWKFRKLREQPEYSSCSIEELENITARKVHVSAENIKQAIEKWMFNVPLELVKNNADRATLALMDRYRNSGYQIVIYSDYPAEDKLRVLDVVADKIYYPSEKTFSGLKPSKESISYIIEDADIDISQLIVVGDRDEKDGETARLVGAQYIDVKTIRSSKY